MAKYNFDKLEVRILEELSIDALLGNKELAKKLEVSENAVRSRIKRMLDKKVFAIRARCNDSIMPKMLLAHFAIDVRVDNRSEVASALVDHSAMTFVAKMAGNCNILAVAMLEDQDGINALRNQVERMPGVLQLSVNIALKKVKFNPRWCRLL